MTRRAARGMFATVVIVALVLGSFSATASAAKKKKKRTVSDSFTTGQLLPFPNLDATGTARKTCFGGVEDVNWAGVEFEAPFTGHLTITSEGFTGDWDMAVLDFNGVDLYSANDQTTAGVIGPGGAGEKIELDVTSGDTMTLALCAWVGAGTATADYELVE